MQAYLRAFGQIFPALFLGCLGCFALHVGLGWSAILSASTLGFLITFLPLPHAWDPRMQQLAFATGTFIAMNSPQTLANPVQVAEISAIGAALLVVARSQLNGIGGKLGFLAFVTTAVWLLIGFVK